MTQPDDSPPPARVDVDDPLFNDIWRRTIRAAREADGRGDVTTLRHLASRLHHLRIVGEWMQGPPTCAELARDYVACYGRDADLAPEAPTTSHLVRAASQL